MTTTTTTTTNKRRTAKKRWTTTRTKRWTTMNKRRTTTKKVDEESEDNEPIECKLKTWRGSYTIHCRDAWNPGNRQEFTLDIDSERREGSWVLLGTLYFEYNLQGTMQLALEKNEAFLVELYGGPSAGQNTPVKRWKDARGTPKMGPDSRMALRFRGRELGEGMIHTFTLQGYLEFVDNKAQKFVGCINLSPFDISDAAVIQGERVSEYARRVPDRWESFSETDRNTGAQ